MCNKEYVKEVLFLYVYKEVRMTLYYSWYQNTGSSKKMDGI